MHCCWMALCCGISSTQFYNMLYIIPIIRAMRYLSKCMYLRKYLRIKSTLQVHFIVLVLVLALIIFWKWVLLYTCTRIFKYIHSSTSVQVHVLKYKFLSKCTQVYIKYSLVVVSSVYVLEKFKVSPSSGPQSCNFSVLYLHILKVFVLKIFKYILMYTCAQLCL